ncbi:MAG: DUF4065 domain-containing protein [Thaumarchaeota archaeon]|nr:DUF4065 domain-containing protein [Nitrososphaerota archaeon]
MHSALWVADYIAAIGGGELTPLHILKMTYMSHGYVWGISKHRLISDNVEAWKYGPVYPTVYEAFNTYGNNPVKSLHFCGTILSKKNMVEKRIINLESVFDEKEKEVIYNVIKAYSDWTGGELIALMHQKGTPWRRHYIKNYTGIVIPDEDTKNYYTQLVNDRR